MLVVRERGLRTIPKTKVDTTAWWIDSGATTHVCKYRCWFKTFEPVKDRYVLYMGDEHFTPVHGKGSVVSEFSSEKTVTLFNVLYVPKLRKNLVSGPVLNKCGYKQVYEFDKCILSKCGVFVGFGHYNNGMFMLNLNKVLDDSNSVYMSSSSTVVNISLWHARLGHVHYKRILEISKDDLIHAIDENSEKCTACMLTKITRKPFQSITRKSAILELIHSDLCYFHATPSLGNKNYVITFIDDASRFCYVYLLHAKDEALDKFRIYKTEVKLKQNDLIKTLRTDRGGEYYDHVFFQSVGIIHETTTPYTSQQNGVAERKNKALKEMDIIPNEQESQIDDHIDDVLSEILEPRKGFGYYNNGMFMLNLNKVPNDSDSIYMFSSTVVNSSLWHARLEHVHYKRMLEMSKDDLIPAIDENLEKCTTSPYTPQQNGVAEKKNKALKEMVNSMLFYSGLSERLWGEAMLTACYLLNRVPNKRNKTIPYELCIEEDPITYNEAMQSQDAAFWKEAVDDEIGSIMENDTWSHYIEKILKKFNREDCSPVSTPMDPVEKLKPKTRKPVDQLEYSRAIGCLMYAMTGYSDASWINHVEDSSSMSGWVFLLGGGAISWASKKQTCITSSAMKSEFVALAAAGKEVEWLRNLIHESPIRPKPIAPISI
nr:zinc finger, CCHC-type [Tanacetum cinerariifolium]